MRDRQVREKKISFLKLVNVSRNLHSKQNLQHHYTYKKADLDLPLGFGLVERRHPVGSSVPVVLVLVGFLWRSGKK
jgi:hypothetical protein